MTIEEPTEGELIDAARRIHKQRDDLEAALAKCRLASKSVAMRLIFDHGYNLNRVALLTGHMRPTLRIWVESEIAKRADDGLQSPSVDEISTRAARVKRT
jgi:hypothetical protein